MIVAVHTCHIGPPLPKWNDLLDDQERRGLRPQGFQSIVRPLVGVEDVDDRVAIIQHDPTRCGSAFRSLGPHADLGKFLSDFFGDRAELPLIFARADHEVIGKGGQLMDVQNQGVNGGRIRDDFRNADGKIATVSKRLGRLNRGDFTKAACCLDDGNLLRSNQYVQLERTVSLPN
jgi:hypothetical protein